MLLLTEIDIMDLHHKLRKETENLHRSLEQHSVLKNITDNKLTLSEYREIIKKFYGYILPAESQLPAGIHPYFEQRKKICLLEQDLLSLKLSKPTWVSIPRCQQIPRLEQEEDILGYLYVMEGSTLGGQIITRMVEKTLALTVETGLAFFHAYGKKTKFMWEEFCVRLNAVIEPGKQEKIIKSAITTFDSLYQWMLHF